MFLSCRLFVFLLFLLFGGWGVGGGGWGGGGVKAKGATDYVLSDQQSFVLGLNTVTSKRSFRA